MDIENSIGDLGSIADSTLKHAGLRLLFEGDVVGDYRVLALLGMGGIGQVYLVENVQMGKQYALKIFPQELSAHQGFVCRFRADAAHLADMRHNNIAHLHYFGQDRQRSLYYVVTDYVQTSRQSGCTLERYVKDKGQVPEAEVATMAGQICDALAYAHGFSGGCVLHCALKPANVLVDDAATAILTDFGLTRMTGDKYVQSLIAGALSASVASIGGAASLNENSPGDASCCYASLMQTREYMAPEVQSGEAASVHSDIYSAGMVLYWILTGRSAKGRWKLPSEYGRSKGWDDIVSTAMRTRPSERYSNVIELLTDIRNISLDGVEYAEDVGAGTPRVPRMSTDGGDAAACGADVGHVRQFINSKARSLGRFGGILIQYPLIRDTDSVEISAQDDVLRILVRWVREVRRSDLATEAGSPPPGHEPPVTEKPFDVWAYESCYSGNWERQTATIRCIPAKYTGPCASCGQSGELKCPECHGNKTFVCPECQGKSKTWILKRCKRCRKAGEIICERCRGTGYVSCLKCKGTGVLTTYNVIHAEYVPESATSVRRCDAPGIAASDPIPTMAVGTVLLEKTYASCLPSFIHHPNEQLSREISAFANRVVGERQGHVVKLMLKVEQIPRFRVTVQRPRRSFAIDLCGSTYELQPVGCLPLSLRPIIGAAVALVLIVLILLGIAFLRV